MTRLWTQIVMTAFLGTSTLLLAGFAQAEEIGFEIEDRGNLDTATGTYFFIVEPFAEDGVLESYEHFAYCEPGRAITPFLAVATGQVVQPGILERPEFEIIGIGSTWTCDPSYDKVSSWHRFDPESGTDSIVGGETYFGWRHGGTSGGSANSGMVPFDNIGSDPLVWSTASNTLDLTVGAEIFTRGDGSDGIFSREYSILATTQELVVGLLDDFEDESSENWFTGEVNPANVVDPDDESNRVLQLTSDGGSGEGSRLVIYNQHQWAGDYVAVGVGGIRMKVKNVGDTDLVLRLAMKSADDLTFLATTKAAAVSAGSAWQIAVFSIEPEDLTIVEGTGDPTSVLENVVTLRLMHAPEPAWSGKSEPPVPAIAAQLLVDDIEAVPEPTLAWLQLTALSSLLAILRLRRRRSGLRG